MILTDLTLAEALNRLSDVKPARRKAAAEGLSEALAARAPTLALVLNTVAADKAMEDRWRGFKRPADSRHLANEVDGEAVDAMAEAVAAAYPRLSHRYYALKAKAMGKARLDHWDRNAPIETTAPRAFTWGQGREIVLDSFSENPPQFERLQQRLLPCTGLTLSSLQKMLSGPSHTSTTSCKNSLLSTSEPPTSNAVPLTP